MNIKKAIIIILCLAVLMFTAMYFLYISTEPEVVKPVIKKVETELGPIDVEIEPGEDEKEIEKEVQEAAAIEKKEIILESINRNIPAKPVLGTEEEEIVEEIVEEIIEEKKDDPVVIEEKVNKMKSLLLN